MQPDGTLWVFLNQDLIKVQIRIISVIHQDNSIPHRLLYTIRPDIYRASRQMVGILSPSREPIHLRRSIPAVDHNRLPCFISCGNFVSSTESCRSIYYILRCKDTAIWAKHKTFSVFFAKMQSYPWLTSKISGIFRASYILMDLNLCIFLVVSLYV